MPKMRRPADGYDWNPLLQLPRNMACPCESGKKFKQCCLKTMPEIIEYKQAQEYKPLLKDFKRLRFDLRGEPPENGSVPPAHANMISSPEIDEASA